MRTKDNKRRWLLWVVLLTAVAASAETGAQEQEQLQIQQQQMQQQQLQQQQLMQQQLQQQLQQQQEQQAQNANASKGLSAAYLDCRKRATGMSDQQRCIEREHRLQEDRLARAYDTVRYRLSGSNRAKLMDAQYAWEQSDAQASDLDKALKGRGQATALQSAEAALERISARANELEQYARPSR